MKVIKAINNNVSRCLDSAGRELIAFGKGIGFFKPGEEIPLSQINRTFYNIKDTDFAIIRNIPTLIINTAIRIVDYASDKLSVSFPSGTALVLADHLQFAIERKDKNIYLPLPLIQDIRQLYPEEMEAAEEALRIIKNATGVSLPRTEAGTLAMHFINDRIQKEDPAKIDTAVFIKDAASIIEEHFHTVLDKNSFNYSRFVTHMDYLLRRLLNCEQIASRNLEIMDQMKSQFPDAYECAGKIADRVREVYGFRLHEEEILYLSIHINRMITRIE